MFSGVRRWWNAYLFKRDESIAQRAQIEAGYAVLTWRFDTRDLIQAAVLQYPRSSRHELVVMQSEADGSAIDIRAQKIAYVPWRPETGSPAQKFSLR